MQQNDLALSLGKGWTPTRVIHAHTNSFESVTMSSDATQWDFINLAPVAVKWQELIWWAIIRDRTCCVYDEICEQSLWWKVQFKLFIKLEISERKLRIKIKLQKWKARNFLFDLKCIIYKDIDISLSLWEMSPKSNFLVIKNSVDAWERKFFFERKDIFKNFFHWICKKCSEKKSTSKVNFFLKNSSWKKLAGNILG